MIYQPMVAASLLCVACVLMALGLFIWRANPARPVNLSFASFTMAVAVWTLGIAGVNTGYYLGFWASISFAAASLAASTFIRFAYVYPTRSRRPPRLVMHVSLILGGAFALLSMGTSYIFYDISLTVVGINRKTGPLYPMFATYFVVTWVTALAMLFAKWRQARGLDRLQLQYLGAAIIIPLAGSVTTNLLIPLLTGRSTYNWVGPYFMLILIILIAHAIIRHRLMDLRLVVRRGLTVAIAAVLSFIPVAALVALIWPRLASELRPGEILVLLLAIAVVTLLVPVTRDVAGRLLDRYVYRRRANYQRTVREASRVLTRVLDLRVLLPFLRDTVIGATESEGVVIYLRDDRRFGKALAESRHAGSRFEAPEEIPTALVAALAQLRDSLVVDDLSREPVPEAARQLHEELTGLNWALVLPVMSEDVVIGAVVLGPKLSGDPFDPQDLDLLMTLANQAGIALKNAQLYAQVVLANEHLQSIVATINSGVVAVDSGSEITMFNPAAEQLTGLGAAEARGRSASILPAPLGHALAGAVRDGFARTEPEVDLSDGATTRPVMCTTSPLRDPAGGILGAVAVFSDLTLVKELEAERRRAERLAYLEAIAAGVAHEIKNPLVSVKTFVQLIPRRRDDERFIENFSRMVGREIERMERLVASLRTLARPAARSLHRLDVRQPVLDALEFMQASFEEKGLVVDVDLGDAEVLVSGDRGELEGLFLNLLINAHQATPVNGRVQVRLARADGHASVEVGDSGPGIPPDLLGRVFDPFFTTKQRGSGLGLAICAGIADAHRAHIRAANGPEGGARITVEFPLAALVATPVA